MREPLVASIFNHSSDQPCSYAGRDGPLILSVWVQQAKSAPLAGTNDSAVIYPVGAPSLVCSVSVAARRPATREVARVLWQPVSRFSPIRQTERTLSKPP